MADKYINPMNLSLIWSKIKASFVQKDGDKVLSDNNYTDTDKQKVDGAVQSESVGASGGVCPLDENGLVPSANIPSQEYTGLFIAHAKAVEADDDSLKWKKVTMTQEEISAVAVHYELGESIRLEVGVEIAEGAGVDHTVVLNLSEVDNSTDIAGYRFDAIRSFYRDGVYAYNVSFNIGSSPAYNTYKIQTTT